MEEENTEQPRRKAGRPKKKRTTGVWDARRICDEAGCNPIEVALFIIKNGYFPVAPGRVRENVSLAQRTRLLEQVIGYVAPRLSSSTTVAAVQVQETVPFDVTQLMKNPELARAAQTLALGMIDAEKAATQGDRDPVIEADMWRAIDGPKNGDNE